MGKVVPEGKSGMLYKEKRHTGKAEIAVVYYRLHYLVS